MFTKFKIRTRLAIVVLVPVIALLGLAALGYRTLYSSRIGSHSYQNIVLAKDLVSDVNPPQQYVVESYNTALLLVTQTDPTVRTQAIAQLTADEKTYENRHAFWAQQLAPGTELRKELVENSYSSARAFFDALDTKFVPAIQQGDIATARSVLDSQLTPAFAAHRASIEKVVKLADDRVTFFKAYADNLVRQRTIQLILALVAVAILIVVVSTLVARSIIRPVKQLTRAAEEAEATLPQVVAAVQQGTPESGPSMRTVTVDSRDELGTLADALNQMQTTAVQLATEQAHTRRNVSTMLANLARRNQSLLNRTLSFISQLEEHERDPETLENLFKLDHLATRMRRNAESLLVLAGSDPPRTWPRPIEVSEVARAALSEIEAYDRVELNQVETVWVRGSVVSDLTHLLAELLDNATRFSPPTTTVSVVGKLTDKGYLVSIIDAGMGMSAEDLARANAELDSIGRPEDRSTMVLGLAVVGRLAARSGIHVRLTESPFEGVTAQVRVPFELLQTPTAEPSGAFSESPEGPNLRPAAAGVGPAPGSSVAAAAAAVAAATASVRSAATAAPVGADVAGGAHADTPPVGIPRPVVSPSAVPSAAAPVAPAPVAPAPVLRSVPAPPAARPAPPPAPTIAAPVPAAPAPVAPAPTAPAAPAARMSPPAGPASGPPTGAIPRPPVPTGPMSEPPTGAIPRPPAPAAPVVAPVPPPAPRPVAPGVPPAPPAVAPSAPPPAPVRPAAAAPAAPIPTAETTSGGLIKRVPGANLFESGPGEMPAPPPVDRSAEAIRDALSSFQYGFQRRPAAPPRREEEDA